MGGLRVRVRVLMLCVVVAGLAFSLPGPNGSTASARRAARPNVLVIMTDDQRADGYQVMPKTMTRLREGGTRFRNAVATHPLCCPSRVSVFTGQYSHNHGVRFNGGQGFGARTTTIQYELQQAGYNTAIAGKFLNFWKKDPPNFDRWAIFRAPGFYSSTFNVDGVTRPVSQYSTTFIRKRAVEFMRYFEKDDKTPWLLFVHPWAPHLPSIPAERYADAPVPGWRDNPARLETDRSDKPPYVRAKSGSKAKVQNLRAQQLRTLMSVDDMAGALFRRLDRLGETNNTLIIFLSDNGFQWLEHQLVRKRFPYESAVRIPMFVSWPGHVPAGDVRKSIVGTIDVAPTIFDAARIEPGYEIDGRPMFESDREDILIEYWQESDAGAPPTWKSLWHPKWTYVEYPEIGVREYYGPEDPWQLTNVFRDGVRRNAPANAEELAKRLASAASCAGSSCP